MLILTRSWFMTTFWAIVARIRLELLAVSALFYKLFPNGLSLFVLKWSVVAYKNAEIGHKQWALLHYKLKTLIDLKQELKRLNEEETNDGE